MRMLSANKKLPVYLINTLWEKMFIPKNLLENVAQVWVRESFSYEEAVRDFGKEKVKLVPDLLFGYDIPELPKVGYSDSVLEVPRAFLSKKSNFFPMNSNGNSPDFLSRCAWMKSLNLLITGRFHDIVMASMLNVPFLAIPSNSHKNEGLLKDMGCSELLCFSYDEVESKAKYDLALALIGEANKFAVNANLKIKEQFKETFGGADDRTAYNGEK
jgi:exopolysaccharide biosynthesis predicted pyruvyltransferase EpsI